MNTLVGQLNRMSRFARFDRPFWLADGRTPKNRPRSQAVAAVLFVVVAIVMRIVVSRLNGVGIAFMMVMFLGLFVWYCIWRRRRNRALTGSPTTWPDEDL